MVLSVPIADVPPRRAGVAQLPRVCSWIFPTRFDTKNPREQPGAFERTPGSVAELSNLVPFRDCRPMASGELQAPADGAGPVDPGAARPPCQGEEEVDSQAQRLSDLKIEDNSLLVSPRSVCPPRFSFFIPSLGDRIHTPRMGLTKEEKRRVA